MRPNGIIDVPRTKEYSGRAAERISPSSQTAPIKPSLRVLVDRASLGCWPKYTPTPRSGDDARSNIPGFSPRADLDVERQLSLKIGTRLVREWHGRTCHVTVLEEGFLFEDRRYASLTQIARAVTGANWSGPRFFGLRQRVRSGKEQAGQNA